MTFDFKSLKDLVASVGVSEFPADFSVSDSLYEKEYLDSLSIVQLVTRLEETLNISFDFNDLTRKNFRSVQSIADMLQTKYGIEFK